MPTYRWLDKHIVRSPCSGSLLVSKKEWSSDSCYNMDEPGKHDAGWQKPVQKDYILLWFHLREKSRIDPFIQIKKRSAVVWGQNRDEGCHRNEEWLLMNIRFLSGMLKILLNSIVAMLVQLCDCTEKPRSCMNFKEVNFIIYEIYLKLL